ncbi:hypothetical protein [Mesobacillus jeotgali]|uniref:Uncharacterized protein n=1 Tax=Mesobacillus jeotgali TaxID=129985 RepID=A0ABY9VCH3_9BACI|nr:hypothetical protein [Mesobacillus jeotgali]WNF21318.1 hypothetical protein RH061_14050 [Mesobacillus jeotgali]
MITEKNLDRLYIKINNKWVALPEWSNYFINLGKTFHSNLSPNIFARMVLTLPSRDYAGVFTGAGTILSMLSSELDEKVINDHFEDIKNQKVGTSVIYRKKDRIYRGIFSGKESVGGEERLKITIQNTSTGSSRSLTELLNRKQALSVQIAENKDYKLPQNPQGKEVKQSPFLKLGFAGYDISRLLTLSQSNFYYIGRKKRVMEEAVETEIAVLDPATREYIASNLNELLRIKDFVGEQESYQCTLIPSSSKDHSFGSLSPSTFTIFDGATSYLRWAEQLKNTHWILILDRTEVQFQNALFHLQEEYLLSSKQQKQLNIETDIPMGVEMMYWEVAQE